MLISVKLLTKYIIMIYFDCGRINSVGRALDCRQGGRGINSRGRTNTQGLKIVDRSGMYKSSSAICLLQGDVLKGYPSPTWLRKYQEEDEQEVVKRPNKESEIIVS